MRMYTAPAPSCRRLKRWGLNQAWTRLISVFDLSEVQVDVSMAYVPVYDLNSKVTHGRQLYLRKSPVGLSSVIGGEKGSTALNRFEIHSLHSVSRSHAASSLPSITAFILPIESSLPQAILPQPSASAPY
jgi:hypothetical protein